MNNIKLKKELTQEQIKISDILVDARILVSTDDHIELAHESLIIHWKELDDWINHHKEFLLWRKRLRETIEDWDAKKRPADLLFGESKLVEYEERFKESEIFLSEKDKIFLNESRDDYDRKKREEENQRSLSQRQEIERMEFTKCNRFLNLALETIDTNENELTSLLKVPKTKRIVIIYRTLFYKIGL